MVDVSRVVETILHTRRLITPERGLLVGVSGIDGSGKGYITKQLEARIIQHSISTANINVDGWLNLPKKRFSKLNPGEHFYKNAIRFHELFSGLLLPLRDCKSVEVVVDSTEETADHYFKRSYSYKNIGVILVEGIFLFKREYRQLFDLKVWVECSFGTALARAVERKQEGLPAAATIQAYETTYFPAQRIHMELDQPSESVDLIVNNDPYLLGPGTNALAFQGLAHQKLDG
jgi:uridine kinase